MSESTSIVKATDAQIRAFETDLEERKRFVTLGVTSLGPGTLHLNQCWQAANLAHANTSSGNPGRLLFGHGDVNYQDLDDPTHAVFSETVKACAVGLQEIWAKILEDGRTAEAAQAYLQCRHSDRRLGRLIGDKLCEAIMYFERLRDFVCEAAQEGMGLIVCHYEDW